MTTIGGINVTISATTDKFTKGIKTASKSLGSFVSAANKAVFSVKGLAVALTGGVAAGAFVKFTKDAFGSIDAMGELSDKLGVSTKHLKGLQIAAEEAGVGSSTLEKAMVTLNKNGMGGEAGLRQWIDDTSKLGTHQERLAATTAMFGSRGSDMVRMLVGGTAALDEAQAASKAFGWSLSRSAVAGVEAAMDAFGRLKTALTGIFAQTAVTLAPYVEVFTTKLTDFVTANGRVKDLGTGIADAVISAAKFVADGIQKMVGSVIGMVADVRDAIASFRGSTIADWAGAGWKNDQEKADWHVGTGNIRYMHDDFMKTPASNTIDSLVKDARAAAAAAAAKREALMAAEPSKAFGALKAFGGSVAKNFGNWGSSVLGSYKGALMNGGRAMMGTIKPPERQDRGTFAFAESGSADSYRQRAAMKRENENGKVWQEQLTQHKKMVALLEAIAGGGGMEAANI